MQTYKIVSDTTTDLPEAYCKEKNVCLMSVPYTLEGITYDKNKTLDVTDFYTKMRNGSMPTTSQINPMEIKEYMQEFLKETNQILYLAFSSGLSGTYGSARLAAEELMDENKNCTIYVVDSKAASLGEGLLLHKALKLQEEGKTMEEVKIWLEANLLHMVHIVTVDDLNHLYRGGRVSKMAAMFGTVANIKPILHIDDEGRLIAINKVRGRKKSLHTLVDYMQQHMGNYQKENDIVFISHGDNREDAEFVAAEIKERFGIDSFLINYIGPTIGTHSGPGTIALFFMGETR